MIDFLLEQFGLRRISKIKPPPPTKLGDDLIIDVREGANGRWRWFAYSKGDFIASGHPKGFDSSQDARLDAIVLFRRGHPIQDVRVRSYSKEG